MAESPLPTLAPTLPTHALPEDALPQAVETALAALREQGAGDRSLSILVNDPQRHTDTPAVLRILAARTDIERSRVVIATGTHTFPADQRAAFERRVFAEVSPSEVSWHDARAENLSSLTGPADWRAHPWVAEGGPLLAIGSVEPHYFAGLTGAHKTCTIGVGSLADVERNHAHALDPASGPGRLDGNPVYDGIAAMVETLEARAPLAGVNLVQAGETLVGCSGGRILPALREAAPPALQAFTANIPAAADAMVLEVTGPLGRTMYQADKAIKNNEHAVRDGGMIVLVASCEQGVGQAHFVHLLEQARTAADARDIVRRRGYCLGDHKAVRLRHLTDPSERSVRVWAVTPGLTRADLETLQFRPAGSVDEAFAAAAMDVSRQAVYRVRDAGNVVVRAGA
jgi:nickel-dependent lactate racemase